MTRLPRVTGKIVVAAPRQPVNRKTFLFIPSADNRIDSVSLIPRGMGVGCTNLLGLNSIGVGPLCATLVFNRIELSQVWVDRPHLLLG